jgi:DNA-directed RNA polymerase specialized sigma24 family protein
LVKLRYFIGMSFEEAASVLGIAVPTAKKWWAYGRAWLAVALRPSLEVGGPPSPSPVQAGPDGEKKV